MFLRHMPIVGKMDNRLTIARTIRANQAATGIDRELHGGTRTYFSFSASVVSSPSTMLPPGSIRIVVLKPLIPNVSKVLELGSKSTGNGRV